MRILFDRNVEPKYINAIAAIQDVTVEHVDDRLPQTANDREIVDLADREDWVVFTRDDDFFQHARGQGIGLIFFSKRHSTLPGKIATAIELIKDAYQSDYRQIEEGVPGQWT